MTEHDPAPGGIRVLIADDNEILVDTLTLALSSAGIEVVGTAGDGPGALAAAATSDPDVVVMDLRLGGDWGLDLVPELRTGPHPPAVVVFSASEDAALDEASQQAGVFRRVHKGAALSEVLQAVREAAARRR